MLTKTDCLSEELNPQSSAIDLGNPHLRDAIYYAMDLYRKDSAIEFHRWMNKSGWYEHSSNMYYYRSKKFNQWPPDEIATAEQLFELFLQSINQK